jgi:hypothetical protein
MVLNMVVSSFLGIAGLSGRMTGLADHAGEASGHALNPS